MISSELFIPYTPPSSALSVNLSSSTSPVLTIPEANSSLSESSFLISSSNEPIVYSLQRPKNFMLMEMMTNGSTKVSSKDPNLYVQKNPSPIRTQAGQQMPSMTNLLVPPSSSHISSTKMPVHQSHSSHISHTANRDASMPQGGMIFHQPIQQQRLQHYSQPHQTMISHFDPKVASPSPGSAGAVYLENEKSATPSPPPLTYSSHIHSERVWYQPNHSHNTQMSQCIPSSSISPTTFQEGYPGPFAYQQLPIPEVIDHNGLYRPIQISPSVHQSHQLMMVAAKRNEAFSSITMKLKKKRESHNAVERRRRDNINERIQFLSSIVPECKRRQIKASMLANDDMKKSSVPTAQLKLNKSFILQKATEYIEALSEYVEKQSMLLKRLVPAYTGGIDELNMSLLDDNEIDCIVEESENAQGNQLENMFIESPKPSLGIDVPNEDVIAQDVVDAQIHAQVPMFN